MRSWAVLLAVPLAAALQPPPQALHKPPAASSRDTLAVYGAGFWQIGVFPCDGRAGSQTFSLNANNQLTFADGRCLLRDAAAPAGLTAGACDGTPSCLWTVIPCNATGCTGGSNQSWVQSGLDGLVLGIPGAVGPYCDVWTIDNPTGGLHNELWAWNATDSTVRSLNTGGPPDIFQQCLTAVPPPPPPPPCTLTPRVACHVGTWKAVPGGTPSNGVQDGPLLGNGDLGAVLTAKGGAINWWHGKSDLWATNTVVDAPQPALHSDTFYTAIGAGLLSLMPAAGATVTSFTAAQILATATVNASIGLQIAGGAAVNVSISASWIAADENTLIVQFSFTSADGQPVAWNVTTSQQTDFHLPLSASSSTGGGGSGGGPNAVWSAKGGVTATDNSLLIMPCDFKTYVYYPSISTWQLANSSQISLQNGTATTAVPLCPHQVSDTKITIGPCSDPTGLSNWALVPAPTLPAASGYWIMQNVGNNSACAWPQGAAYHNSGGLVSIGSCNAQAQLGQYWQWDPNVGQLHWNATQCLTAVPPNVNITMGMAAGVFTAPAAGAAPLPFTSTSSTQAADGSSVQATGTVLLQSGTPYTLVLSGVTNRDFDFQTDPVAGALAGVAAYANAPAYLSARQAAHAAYWQEFWNASSIQLDDSRQLLEGFWYGSQYLLGCTARAGKVAPGLWGVFALLDSNGWNGDFTLDYNAQANFYGACSSNRCELLRPYMDSVGSEWHLEVSRQRAAANWLAKGSAGGPGQTAQSMCCGYMDQAYENPHICPSSNPGSYAGIEMTTHIGPYPQLYYFSDLSLRMVAAMSAMPFRDYADYTGDLSFLNTTAYPFLRGVADFYASYVTYNASTGRADILQSCAQEICGGGPAAENNPHHDIAFLTAVLRALVRWSGVLNRDPDMVPQWQALAAALAPYPVGNYKGTQVWLEADDTESYFMSNAGGYPIVYWAALHPAEVVSQSSDPDLVSTGCATVLAVNAQNSWHPGNGLCMAWPPITRCANGSTAAVILDAWEGALTSTMCNNFWPDLNGGGIEQAGATEAVNSALLQSQEGFMRFFPMWPPTENATFTNLRARGAFLVSGAFTAGAVQQPVLVTADAAAAPYARNCTFMNPWSSTGTPAVRQLPGNTSVPVQPAGSAGGYPLFSFVALPGLQYSLWTQ